VQALVTGGGGFLGRYIVEQLLARGDAVRVLARGEYPELRAQGVHVVRGDVRDAAAVTIACEGVETVFHTAAVPGIWGPWEHYYQTNTVGTRNVVAACRARGVTRLVYTSSPSVVFDGRPHEDADESLPYPATYLCHYPHSKAIAEREVLAANEPGRLLTVSLRPHLIWGPRDNHLIPRLIRRAKSGRLRRVGDGTNRVSVSYVENAAAAHLQANDALANGGPGGRAYFINEPQPVNLWSWIDGLLDRAGLPAVRRSLSTRTAYAIGRCCEATYRALRIQSEPPMTRFLALQLAESHHYNVNAAIRDCGYRPQVSMETGLTRLEPELQRWARGLES
jgi:nucleoside-diphosphate-sugar epimerase